MSEQSLIGDCLARPRSDKKRQAILDAAVELFADRGIGHSPTSAISSSAGVAEGTLFTYFKTKDELLNELYRDMRKEIDQAMADYPFGGDTRVRLRFVWDRFLDMAEKHPKRLKVQQQLRSSGRLLKDAEEPNMVITELLRASSEGAELGGLDGAAPEYLVLMFRAHAEATAEFIAAHRDMKFESRELGFRLVWRALVGE